ncbi:DcaP family trimeric outer membrane transporter [uncultured Sphingomonas sp.]|uniref:DcaP family trimeric outer membrane transporter n=1 Tax=uncultured Sphingomonas sp. TaxID=158754 RepID=UPI0025F19107|nr:DcaP family trimeric outer membrane transporter [uncultured Sphingomonas sp.]
MPHSRQRTTRAVLLSGLMLAGTTPAAAQTAADYQALRNKVDALQRQLDTVQRALAATQPSQTLPAVVAAASPTATAATSQPQGVRDPLPRPAGAPSITAQGGPSTLPAGYGFRIGETSFRINGFIKGDLIFSRYGNGDTATNPLGRELSLPQSIPVGGRRSGILADASAKQSRIAFQTATPVGASTVTTLIEADFQVAPTVSGGERALNPYAFGLRRAVAGYGGFAVGQDWSNFQYVAALPETADFVGVTDGTVLVRQMQLRYSRPVGRGWSISASIENPETVSAMAGAPALSDNDDDSIPDLTGQLLWSAKGASLSLTGLLRSMRVDPANGRPAATARGYGMSLAGIAPLPTGTGDDIRFMMTGGRGLGRYVGANVAADAIYDAADDRLEPVPLLAGFVGVRHFWTPGLRSTWMGSFQRIWNPASASPLSTRQVWDTAVNLFVSPLPRLDLGVELRVSHRELANGVSGTLDRLHFTVKQGF